MKTNDYTEKLQNKAYFHLPGLFEFYELYKRFLPLFKEHREYFYDWCEIGSIYGNPEGCLWSGGRVELSEVEPKRVIELLAQYGISASLTFSNSLLQKEHLSDRRCNRLCESLANSEHTKNGVIVHSDLLLNYLKDKYPGLYYVSSTTKVITEFSELKKELEREEFKYVVPDFRLNKCFDSLSNLSATHRTKLEFLCNECCSFTCGDRKKCYEAVSLKNLGEDAKEHRCTASHSDKGYVFSKAMENPGFIGVKDIVETYLPMGFINFKIEGRSLGSALVLEFLLYYMTKPEYQLRVREEIYLDNTLDLF